jgi:hypothetical protein
MKPAAIKIKKVLECVRLIRDKLVFNWTENVEMKEGIF